MNDYYVAAIWIGLALVACLVSIPISVPVALVEIVVGALAGNIPGVKEHVTQPDFVTFLASAGSIVLTFLAGAEIDPVSLKRHWKASLSIGVVSFALPFGAAFGFCALALGWHLRAAEIGGVAISLPMSVRFSPVSTMTAYTTATEVVDNEIGDEAAGQDKQPAVGGEQAAQCQDGPGSRCFRG